MEAGETGLVPRPPLGGDPGGGHRSGGPGGGAGAGRRPSGPAGCAATPRPMTAPWPSSPICRCWWERPCCRLPMPAPRRPMPRLVRALASSGFADTTRVGGGNPELGTLMARTNREALLEALGHFRAASITETLALVAVEIEGEDAGHRALGGLPARARRQGRGDVRRGRRDLALMPSAPRAPAAPLCHGERCSQGCSQGHSGWRPAARSGSWTRSLAPATAGGHGRVRAPAGGRGRRRGSCAAGATPRTPGSRRRWRWPSSTRRRATWVGAASPCGFPATASRSRWTSARPRRVRPIPACTSTRDGQADPDRLRSGALAVAVPGSPAGLWELALSAAARGACPWPSSARRRSSSRARASRSTPCWRATSRAPRRASC